MKVLIKFLITEMRSLDYTAQNNRIENRINATCPAFIIKLKKCMLDFFVLINTYHLLEMRSHYYQVFMFLSTPDPLSTNKTNKQPN